eukprot:TRINITY_DN7847_c0_g1_i4.p1 TRINITY_DN7847_c0_g1~~TRINITY_DN7847_c0_g1_i4.p1  ORF type:complete len:249 (-),score=22.29 TRINITY_DN7847_c0_g1_i4:79-825(-)
MAETDTLLVKPLSAFSFDVRLGMGYNVHSSSTDPGASPMLPLLKDSYVKGNSSKDTECTKAQSEVKVVSSAKDAALALGGSLEVGVDIADVVRFSGKGSLSFSSNTVNKSVTQALRLKQAEYRKILSLDAVTVEDILLTDLSKATHVVKSITYGRGLWGTMNLTSTSKSTTASFKGEAEVKISQIPISGKAEANFDYSNLEAEYAFYSELEVVGGGGLTLHNDAKSFVDTITKFYNPSIILTRKYIVT